jgi:hypothetical protein
VSISEIKGLLRSEISVLGLTERNIREGHAIDPKDLQASSTLIRLFPSSLNEIEKGLEYGIGGGNFFNSKCPIIYIIVYINKHVLG